MWLRMIDACIRMVLVCNKWRKRLDYSAMPVLSCLMYAGRQVDNVQNHDDGLQAPAIARHDITLGSPVQTHPIASVGHEAAGCGGHMHASRVVRLLYMCSLYI